MRVVAVDELLQRLDLLAATHVGVGKASPSFIRDDLDRLQDGIDNVRFLSRSSQKLSVGL